MARFAVLMGSGTLSECWVGRRADEGRLLNLLSHCVSLQDSSASCEPFTLQLIPDNDNGTMGLYQC